MVPLLDFLAAAALLVWGLRCVRDGVAQMAAARLRHWLLGCAPHAGRAAWRGAVLAWAQPDTKVCAQQCAQAVERRLMPPQSALCVLAGTELGLMALGLVLVVCPAWVGGLLTIAGVWVYTRNASLPTRARGRGRTLIGAGLLLIAMHWLQEAAASLVQSSVVTSLLNLVLDDGALAFLVGLVAVVSLGSSLLAMLLVAAWGQAASLSLADGLPLVLGVFAGASVWPLKADPGMALAHGVLRLGVALAGAALAWLGMGAWGIHELGVVGLMALAGACSAAAALAAVLVAPWFSVRCAQWFPRRPVALSPRPLPLEDAPPASASEGLAHAVRAVAQQADLVESMLGGLGPVMRDTDVQRLQALRAKDDEIDRLHSSVKYYLTAMPREHFTALEKQRWSQIADFTISLEQAGDVIEHMLQDLVTRKFEKNRLLSPRSVASLEAIVQELHTTLRMAMSVFLHGRLSEAQQLLVHKAAVRRGAQEAARNHLARLADEAAQGHDTSALYLDLLDDLRRINSHLSTVAYAVVHQAQEATALAGAHPEPQWTK